MESKSKVLGHPLHTMMVVMPLGLLIGGVIFDLLARGEKKADRAKVAQTLYGAGIIAGIMSAPPGWWDWFHIPAGTRAKRIGLVHALSNVSALTLFGLSWLSRRDDVENPTTKARVLALSGFALNGLGAWLGGEMVDRLGIGVDRGAHPDAPSSLSGKKTRKMFGSR